MSTYFVRRDLGVCVQCGGEDERTKKGLCRCEECAEKQKKTRNTRKRIRYMRNACTVCGKITEDTLAGYMACKECREKNVQSHKRYLQKKGVI